MAQGASSTTEICKRLDTNTNVCPSHVNQHLEHDLKDRGRQEYLEEGRQDLEGRNQLQGGEHDQGLEGWKGDHHIAASGSVGMRSGARKLLGEKDDLEEGRVRCNFIRC